MEYINLVPGPTTIKEEVRKELAKKRISPDLDNSFLFLYQEVEKKIQRILNTANEVYLLAGEGMLGLDVALANIVTDKDHLLVLDNGIFGRGFKDLASAYTNDITILSFDYHCGIDLAKIELFLQAHPNKFSVATIVDVDTPTGVKNDIAGITKILKKYNIMTIVDAVASFGGMDIDCSNIDILIGASQKAISAPTGLAFLVVSQETKRKISNRQKAIPFYLDLMPFFDYQQKGILPYTMPRELVEAFTKALDLINGPDIHIRFAKAIRAALKAGKLELFLKDSFADTVTAFYPPRMVAAGKIIEELKEDYKIIIADSYQEFKGKLLRIGHMGANCDYHNILTFFKALEEICQIKGMVTSFQEAFDSN